MKAICYNCKYSGKSWRIHPTMIPDCHCEEPEAVEKARKLQSAWETVRSIFDTCDKFEAKQ